MSVVLKDTERSRIRARTGPRGSARRQQGQTWQVSQCQVLGPGPQCPGRGCACVQVCICVCMGVCMGVCAWVSPWQSLGAEGGSSEVSNGWSRLPISPGGAQLGGSVVPNLPPHSGRGECPGLSPAPGKRCGPPAVGEGGCWGVGGVPCGRKAELGGQTAGLALGAGAHQPHGLGQAISPLLASVSPLKNSHSALIWDEVRGSAVTLHSVRSAHCPAPGGPPGAHRLEGHGDPLHSAILDAHGPV